MGIDCGPAPLFKWTEFQGKICQVQVFQNAEGRFTGHSGIAGCGVAWHYPMQRLPEGEFFDSVEEAISGLTDKYNKRASEVRVLCRWLEGEACKYTNLVDWIENRISNLESDVLK